MNLLSNISTKRDSKPGSNFLTLSLQTLIGVDEVPSKSFVVETEHTQLPQPFLVREMFQSLNYSCCPPLKLFQELQVSPVPRSPKLDAEFQLRLHQGWVGGKDPLSQPTGNALLRHPKIPFTFLIKCFKPNPFLLETRQILSLCGISKQNIMWC